MKYVTLFILMWTNVYAQKNFEPCPDIYTCKWTESFKTQIDRCESDKSILQIFTDHSLLEYDECLTLQLDSNAFYLKYNIIKFDSVIEFRRQIDSSLANDIHQLFVVALFHVEYRPVNYGNKDGTRYYLKADFWGHQSELCGFAYEAKAGNLSEFTGIIADLIGFTESKSVRKSESMTNRILELTSKMNTRQLKYQTPEMDEIFDENYQFFNK